MNFLTLIEEDARKVLDGGKKELAKAELFLMHVPVVRQLAASFLTGLAQRGMDQMSGEAAVLAEKHGIPPALVDGMKAEVVGAVDGEIQKLLGG